MSDTKNNADSGSNDPELDSLAERVNDRIPKSTRLTDSLSAYFQGHGPFGTTGLPSKRLVGQFSHTFADVPPQQTHSIPDPEEVERIMRSFAGGHVSEPDPYIPPTPEEMIREGLRQLGISPDGNQFAMQFLGGRRTKYVAISLESGNLRVESASQIVHAPYPELPGHDKEW